MMINLAGATVQAVDENIPAVTNHFSSFYTHARWSVIAAEAQCDCERKQECLK